MHIGVYGLATVRGRGPANTLFYEISLDDEPGTENGLPQYIHESHENKDDSILAELPRERIRLGKGDLFVRNEETAFEYLGPEDASFMLLKFSWD